MFRKEIIVFFPFFIYLVILTLPSRNKYGIRRGYHLLSWVSVRPTAADVQRAAADGRHHPCPAQEEDL